MSSVTNGSTLLTACKLLSHLDERHLQIERYSGVYLGDEDEVITFYLWNLSGKLVGYQQYRPGADKKAKNSPKEGRYYTYVSGERKNKEIAVWGLETLSYECDFLIICEGIFDACRFHNHGIPAIALLSGDIVRYRGWLDSLGKNYIFAVDDHGSNVRGCSYIVPPSGVADFGDCTEEELQPYVRAIKGS